MSCRQKMKVHVAKGYGYREITVKCGNTSPYGTPYLCEKCERIHADRDWRKEAQEAGETWSEEDY